MKICILTPRFPYPQFGGDTLRINEVARYLKKQGHTLVLVSLSDDTHPALDMASALYDTIYFVKRSRWGSLFFSALYFLMGRPMQCGYYHSNAFAKLFHRVVAEEKPDLYVSHLLRMCPYLINEGLQQHSIIEMTDALSKTYGLSSAAKGVGLLKYVYSLEQKLIAGYEQTIIRTFPKIVLVSRSDADFLTQESHARNVAVHTNGVGYLSELPDHYNQDKICFIGNMRSMQNQDAVIFFVKEVFPLILQNRPKTKFYIVGSLPPENIQSLASDNVIVTGFVENLEDTISDSCIAVAPVRVAAGIQNKVLVAMGCGIPVVLTSLIAKSIPELKDGENCLIADTAALIAERCLSLMASETRRNSIGQAGYTMVSSCYSWEEKLQKYEVLG